VIAEALPYPMRKPPRPGLLRGPIAESRQAARIVAACAATFLVGASLAWGVLAWFSYLFVEPAPLRLAAYIRLAFLLVIVAGPIVVLLRWHIRWAAIMMLAQALIAAALFTAIALLWMTTIKPVGHWSMATTLDVALTASMLVVGLVWWLCAALCWRAFHAAHFLRRARRGAAASNLAAAFD